jgi:ABC-2 type transport system permease protein
VSQGLAAAPEEGGADPVLREVSGPSALGGGWRRSLELLSLISISDFKKAYFGTVFGYVWSVARPLMLFGVLLVVFTKVFRIGSQVPHYADLLLLNIVLFGFFSEATVVAVTSIVGQEGVVRKTQFPRIVIPTAIVVTAFFNVALNLVVVFAFIILRGVEPMWSWFGLVPIMIALFVITTAVAMIVSTLYPRFRDTAIIWGVFATALFYATPVLYPLELVPQGLRDLILINPLAPLFELSRKWIIDPTAPGPAQAAGGYDMLIAPTAIYVAVCVIAVWLFRREAPRIAEQL